MSTAAAQNIAMFSGRWPANNARQAIASAAPTNYESKLTIPRNSAKTIDHSDFKVNGIQAKSSRQNFFQPQIQERKDIESKPQGEIISQMFTLQNRTMQTSTSNRVHRNSIHRSSLLAPAHPPILPVQNPKQEMLDMMASYQNKLDNRLSQPKMNSPVRIPHDGSRTSLRSMNRSMESGKAISTNAKFDKSIFSRKRDNETDANAWKATSNSMLELSN